MGVFFQWVFLLFFAGVSFEYGIDFVGWFIVIGFVLQILIWMHPNDNLEQETLDKFFIWLQKKFKKNGKRENNV